VNGFDNICGTKKNKELSESLYFGTPSQTYVFRLKLDPMKAIFANVSTEE
jgi:hypothetical protein